VFDEAGDVAVLLSVDAHVGEDEGLFLAVLLQFETGNVHSVNGVGTHRSIQQLAGLSGLTR